ncbi:MAG: hypothetical protein NTW16_00180 [Bacteroidetes bacterium]|nr:hypothetical protein [Bacteroidota bacterium]
MKNTARILHRRGKVELYYYKGKGIYIPTNVTTKQYNEDPQMKMFVDNMFNNMSNVITNYFLENKKEFPTADYVKNKIDVIKNKTDNITSLFEIYLKSKIKVTPETLINIKYYGNFLKRYDEINNIDINKIDDEFITLLSKFIYKTGLSDNVHHCVLVYIKSFITFCIKEKHFPDKNIDWELHKVEVTQNSYEVLTKTELDFLRDKRLTEKNKVFKKILDMFLFCSYSSLRYCDLVRVNLEYLKDDNNRIEMKSKKTKVMLYPSLNENNYSLNLYTITYYDKTLKRMLKKYSNEMESFKKIVKVKKTVEGKETFTDKYRYDCFSSHSGRRSFCTIQLDMGTSPLKIRGYTGHKSDAQLYTYGQRKPESEKDNKITDLLL